VLRASEYRTKAIVKPFAQEFLAPVNRMSKLRSTMLVTEFVEKVYLPKYVQRQPEDSATPFRSTPERKNTGLHAVRTEHRE